MIKSYDSKKRESEEHFKHAVAQKVDETTPPIVTENIRAFAASICPKAPVYVPVVDDPIGLFGWCADGVAEKIRRHGGTITHGWCFWQWRLGFVTAEFHAVWQNDEGRLIDITPKPQGEKHILFATDDRYDADFNFDKRPLNKRLRLYEPTNLAPVVKAQIARMKPAQLNYEEVRAKRAGLALDQWLLNKQPVDPVPELIDHFIDLCDRIDKMMDSIPGTGLVSPPPGLITLEKEKFSVLKQLRQLVPRADQVLP